MQSIAYVPASDGTANASLSTVTTIRSALATEILVNTVAGYPAKFYATMGTPHNFTDPVTGETIQIISEATAIDFAGHTNSGKIEIDAIAPGYVDGGSKVGDIVVIKPSSEWSNNIHNILNQSLNDNGTIKNSAITYQPIVFDHVASGAVLAGLGYGSTLTASLSAGTCYINGILQTIAAVATQTYTASKDTYVDALYNANGTVTIVYTEVANNAASPALAANSIRLGIVVSGANIAAVGSINQGQEFKVLPIASSVAYSVTDSLGNLICPRDPNRKILGYRQTFAAFSTSNTTATQITGLSCPVIVPLGRKIKVSIQNETSYPSASGTPGPDVTIWDGVVGSGTQLAASLVRTISTGQVAAPLQPFAIVTPTVASKTYNAGLHVTGGAGTVNFEALSSVVPGGILVELA